MVGTSVVDWFPLFGNWLFNVKLTWCFFKPSSFVVIGCQCWQKLGKSIDNEIFGNPKIVNFRKLMMNKALELDSRFDIWVLSCAVMPHASCSKVTYIHCTYAYPEVGSFMLNHVQLPCRDITCMLPKSSGFNFQELAVTCVLHLVCVLCFSMVFNLLNAH